MHPFFEILGLRIPAYGTLVALGAIAALTLFLGRVEAGAKRRALLVAGAALLGALLGAKGLYLLTCPAGLSWREKLLGGFVFYGGLAGGLAAGGLAAKRVHLSCLPLLDAAAPAIAIGHGIGRVGCFLAGCCYGRPMPPPLGIVLPQALGAPRDVPLFPVQLLEAACNLALGAFLLYYGRKRGRKGLAPPAGRTSGLYLLLYAGERFFLETLRGDAVRGFAGGLSTSQWGALLGAAAGLVLLCRVVRIDLTAHGASVQARIGPLRASAALRRDAAGALALHLAVQGREIPLPKGGGSPLGRELGRALLPLLRVEALHIRLCAGVRGDAAQTAQLCGALLSGGKAALALLHARDPRAPLCLRVVPDRTRDILFLDARCILSASVGKGMRVSSKILWKSAKGAYRKWRTRLKPSCAPPWKT
ncbi:MAG: prolipoprotein diacylglyceryl transferase family protein [Candidatus Spyradocola sp.]|jgi:phosphatidylglycerol:prolipoprotein diacylglycerol transferase